MDCMCYFLLYRICIWSCTLLAKNCSKSLGVPYLIPRYRSIRLWLVLAFFACRPFLILAGFPYFNEQSADAWLGICFIAVWLTHRHLVYVFRTAISYKSSGEADEPMRYRAAIIGFLGGFLFLSIFSLLSLLPVCERNLERLIEYLIIQRIWWSLSLEQRFGAGII